MSYLLQSHIVSVVPIPIKLEFRAYPSSAHMTLGSEAPPGELINLIFLVFDRSAHGQYHALEVTYNAQAQMDCWTFCDLVSFKGLVLRHVLDILYDHRRLSQSWTSCFVSSSIGDVSNGKDIRIGCVADLKGSLHTHETSIIDGFR